MEAAKGAGNNTPAIYSDMSTTCDYDITLFSVVKFLVVSTTLSFPNFVRQGVEIHESTHK